MVFGVESWSGSVWCEEVEWWCVVSGVGFWCLVCGV